MRSNRQTGDARGCVCGFCGSPTVERRFVAGNTEDKHFQTWWTSDAHNAPCGAPCIGGGVEARMVNGVATFDHAHRVARCGAISCSGGSRCIT
mgnify:CR=1 FL=1